MGNDFTSVASMDSAMLATGNLGLNQYKTAAVLPSDRRSLVLTSGFFI